MGSEWTTCRLSEIADIQTGPFGSQLHNEDYVRIGTPIVTVEHLGKRCFSAQNLPKVSEKDKKRLSKYTLTAGDTVFSRVGSVDRSSFVKIEYDGWMFSGRCLRVRPDKSRVYSEYLYYALNAETTKQQIRNIAVGATMPSINTKLLGEVIIKLPEYFLQRDIAATLSSLDDKIELNNRIIANLEAQAQAIFKSWFVDFEPFQDGEFVDSELGMIPKGWRVGTLSEITSITMGQSPSGTSFNEKGIGTVFYQGRAEFGFRFPSRRLFTTEPKRMALDGDVLMSVRAPVGDINVATEECCIGRGLCSLHSIIGCQSYLLYEIKKMHDMLDKFNGEGTVFGSINKKGLNQLPVLIPLDDAIYAFEQNARKIDLEILNLYKQNIRLERTRDTLLPKLMSGEIEVLVEDIE